MLLRRVGNRRMSAMLGGLTLWALALTARTFSGAWIAPIPAYCGTWGLALMGYALFGPTLQPLFPLDVRVVLFLVVAAVVFSLGALTPHIWSSETPVTGLSYRLRGSVFAGLMVGMLAIVPLAYDHVRALLVGIPFSELLFYARAADVAASLTGRPSILGPYANLVPISTAVAIVAHTVPLHGWRAKMRTVSLFVAALTPLLVGARSASVVVLVSVLGALQLRNQLRVRTAGAIALLFFVLFFGVALLVKKGVRADSTQKDKAIQLVQGLRDYSLGGLGAFQRILLSPNEVPPTMTVARTAAEALNHLGARFTVPPLHAEFSTIGDRVQTNVYTTYFGYLDFGFLGATALTFCYGVGVSLCYRWARRGYATAMALYATLFSGLVLTVFGEGFYSNVNFLGKLAVCSLVLLQRREPEVVGLPGTQARVRAGELDQKALRTSVG